MIDAQHDTGQRGSSHIKMEQSSFCFFPFPLFLFLLALLITEIIGEDTVHIKTHEKHKKTRGAKGDGAGSSWGH